MRTDEGQDPVIEPAQPQRRPGAELARAREAAGIGLRAMADTLHLPEKQVRALEEDDYANLPPPTFVRGYLRSYARALGLDSDDIVGLYDALEVEVEDPGLRLYSNHEDRAHNRGLALAIAVLALAVALSLGAWWWQTRTTESAAGSDTAASGAPAAQQDTASAAGATSGDADSGGETASGTAAVEPDGASGDQGASVASAAADTADTGSSGGEMDESSDGGSSAATEPDSAGEDSAQSEDGGDAATNETSGRTAEADPESATEAAGSPSAAATETDADAGADSPAEPDSPAAGSETDDTAVTAETESTPASNGAGDDAPADAEGGSDSGAVAALSSSEQEGYQPPSQTASASAATAPEASEGPQQLRVNVDGRSWIEIYDARGRELVYTLYTGSEPLQVNGWAPFDVFLGNSPDVSIRFNGETIDKAAFTRSDRTARFLVDTSGANRR